MISDLREMKCKHCGRRTLVFREKVEEKDGNIFWYVRCSSCGRMQKIWMVGEAHA